ncbi:MAG: DUF4239 domain-containing protein [Candidatus Riflebacteria bacterium]|nr:DUF4239 domain-containing protein [Candidatus Riflebacteria bacterium]
MYLRIMTAMIVTAILKVWFGEIYPVDLLKEEIHGVASYLEVLGALYGIILAFIIFVVWDQFNKVQTGIYLEGNAIEDLYHTASFVSDSVAVHQMKFLIREYLETTIADEKSFLARGESCLAATNAFLKISDSVRAVEIKTQKDQVVFTGLLDALVRVNNLRDARLGISSARIPITLWYLIYFYSVAIIAGFFFLGIKISFLSVTVTSVIAGAIFFLLNVIADIDNPFDGTWNISYEPFSLALVRLKTQR